MSITLASEATHDRAEALPEWQPQELGLGRAAMLAGGLVTALAVGLATVATRSTVPPPLPPVIVRLVAPAAMPPSTMAEITPPEAAAASIPQASTLPELASELAVVAGPDLVPMLMPALTQLAVATPIEHPRRPPAPHPVARPPRRSDTVAPPEAREAVTAQPVTASLPTPAPRQAQPAPPDTTSGLGAYQSALHRQIERNMQADPAVARLGVGGTASIIAAIAPDGRLIEAHIARSSGNRAIDQAALGAVQRGGFAAFGLHMPGGPISISVPISVEAD